MRKTHFYLLTTLCLLLTVNSNAQTINDFLSYKTKYDFALPQLEACISLPPNTGFKSGAISQEKKMTNLKNDYAFFCLDTDLLDDSYDNYITFQLDGKPKELLLLSIMKEQTELTNMAVSQRPNFSSHIPSLSTKIGKTTAYQIKTSGKIQNHHIIDHNGYRFVFRFNSNVNSETRNKIEDIIKSFKKKEYVADLRFYNNRQEMKNLEKDIEATKATVSYKKSKTFEGETTTPTTFHFDLVNTSIPMPKNTMYRMTGSELAIDKDNYTLKFDDLDLLSEYLSFNWLTHDRRLYIQPKVYYAGTKFNKEYITETLKDSPSVFSTTKEIVIDGIKQPAYIHGSKDFVTLSTLHSVNDHILCLEIAGIDKNNEGFVDSLLSEIKINYVTERVAKVSKPFSSIFTLETPKEIILDKINLPQFTPKENTKFTIPQLNLEMNLLGSPNNYLIRKGIEKEETMTTNIITDLPIKASDRLSIFSLTNNQTSFSIAYQEKKEPIKEYAKSWKRFQQTMKAMEVVSCGVLTYNDIEWVVLISKNKEHNLYSGTLLANIGNYEIWIYSNNGDLEDMMNAIALVQSFKITK